MNLKKTIPYIVIIALLFSCSDDEVDCSAVDCIGFPSLTFEILENGENVFEQDLFSIEDVSLSGTVPDPSELVIQEGFFGPESTQLLIMTSFAWEETTYDFTINIGNSYTANLIVVIEDSPSGGCCGGIPLIQSLELNGEAVTRPYDVLRLNFDQ